jgi:hypothetical protein
MLAFCRAEYGAVHLWRGRWQDAEAMLEESVEDYGSLSDRPGQAAALDRDFLDFATRFNRGAPGAPTEYRYEYLMLIARKPAPLDD